MSFFSRKNTTKLQHKKPMQGYILPLTLLLTTLIMLVSFGITSIIVRQARFSRIVKDSFIAYNAADMAVTCTSFINQTFQDSGTGNGIFPMLDPVIKPIASSTDEIDATIASVNSARLSRGLSASVTSDYANCAGVHIFRVAETGIVYATTTYTNSSFVTEQGKSSTFNLKLPLSNGDFRCAKVIFNKTASFDQIIASGYSTCDNTAVHKLERVIVSSSEGS